MSTWPVLSRLPDQKNWAEAAEDPAIRSPMEGGYMVTRARYTRLPRITFTFSLTDVTNNDKLAVFALWNETLGGSDAFLFPHPFNGQEYQVRFNKAFKATYAQAHRDHAGSPVDHHWNITDLELLEA